MNRFFTNRFFSRLLLAAAMVAPTAAMVPSADAGRIPGPGIHSTSVEAYDVDNYDIRFRGGEMARIVVSGDGDTDLDVFVYDADENLVASDVDPTDYCVVSWRPRRSATYRVEVHNLGDVYNIYTIETN